MSGNTQEAIEYALNRLESELPQSLTYHSYEHTLRVMNHVKYLAKQAGLPAQEESAVTVAAAFHDIGFIDTTTDHEQAGCRVVESVLPGFGFDPDFISKVRGMILATKVPQNPMTLAEEVLCDADLAYLSYEHYDQIADHLFQELIHLGRIHSRSEWLSLQLRFFEQHAFFTDYAQENFAEGKEANRQRLLNRMMG